MLGIYNILCRRKIWLCHAVGKYINTLMSKWKYNNKQFDTTDINDYNGFVYIMTNTITNKQYIGKKFFYSLRTLKPLKGKKRKRKVKKESDWKKYNSSSKYVLADIEEFGEDIFTFEILDLCLDRAETNYSELKHLIYYQVLERLDEDGDRMFYNENIAMRFYHNTKHNDDRLLLTEKLK